MQNPVLQTLQRNGWGRRGHRHWTGLPACSSQYRTCSQQRLCGKRLNEKHCKEDSMLLHILKSETLGAVFTPVSCNMETTRLILCRSPLVTKTPLNSLGRTCLAADPLSPLGCLVKLFCFRMNNQIVIWRSGQCFVLWTCDRSALEAHLHVIVFCCHLGDDAEMCGKILSAGCPLLCWCNINVVAVLVLSQCQTCCFKALLWARAKNHLH